MLTGEPGVGEVAGDAVQALRVGVRTATGLTVTAAVEVTAPVAFRAVRAEGVVAVGETARDPDAFTVPTPPLISTVVAFSTFQVRVED